MDRVEPEFPAVGVLSALLAVPLWNVEKLFVAVAEDVSGIVPRGVVGEEYAGRSSCKSSIVPTDACRRRRVCWAFATFSCARFLLVFVMALMTWS